MLLYSDYVGLSQPQEQTLFWRVASKGSRASCCRLHCRSNFKFPPGPYGHINAPTRCGGLILTRGRKRKNHNPFCAVKPTTAGPLHPCTLASRRRKGQYFSPLARQISKRHHNLLAPPASYKQGRHACTAFSFAGICGGTKG